MKLKELLSKFKKKVKPHGPREIARKKEVEELKSEIVTKEPERVGLSGKMENIDKKLDILTERAGQFKKKPFKLKSSIKTQLKKAAEKNKVLVIYLGKNRNIGPRMAKVENGFVVIDGVAHNFNIDFTFLWEGKTPCIVLPEWDLNPIGTKDYYEAVDDKRIPDAQTVIIRALKMRDILSDGKQINMKMWIWAGIGVIIVGYVLFGQG